jgi:hypothetical protein
MRSAANPIWWYVMGIITGITISIVITSVVIVVDANWPRLIP